MPIVRARCCAVLALALTAIGVLPAAGVLGCAVGDPRQSYDPLAIDDAGIGEAGDGAPHFDPASPSACAAPKKRCDDLCVDLASDPNNCGACWKKCAAGSTCVSSTCSGSTPPPPAPPECPAGQAKCGGACIDVTSDAANCGSCGGACPSGWSCTKGVCGLTCGAGTIDCGGGVCVTTASDPRNCGACGTACPAGSSCVASACELVCSGGKTKCGDACVKLSSDRANCGACDHACAATELCLAGICWGL